MKRGDGREIHPCVTFFKREDGSGLNASVCSCKDFSEAVPVSSAS